MTRINIKYFSLKNYAYIIATLCCVVATNIEPIRIAALSTSQKKLFDSGVNYFDEVAGSACGASTVTSEETGFISSVYILGDSITERSSDALTQAFQQKNITTTIDASSGRSLEGAGTDGNKLSGMDAITKDKAQIQGSSVIVVALGTNGGSSVKNIDAAIKALRDFNPEAPIYWVDTFGLADSNFGKKVMGPANTAIYGEAGDQKYTVISWAKAVDAGVDPQDPGNKQTDTNGYISTANADLGVHPTNNKGVQALADLVSSTVSSGPGPGSNSGQPTIVIDPGHSGKDQTLTDPETGLHDHDYPNTPEMTDVFDVATLVKTQLEKDGYKVVMTKLNPQDTASLRQRAEIANSSNADLAVSIHDQAGAKDGKKFGDYSEIYAQKVDGYRQHPDGSHKTTFNLSAVAVKSQQYADILQKTRSKAEGADTVVKNNSFDGREKIDPGNLAMVQLFSKVPWVYNEVGGNSGGDIGLSKGDKQKYADGLVAGIEESIPATGGQTGSVDLQSSCVCVGSGTVLTGSDRESQTWNYFKNKGLSDEQVAGIMGNMKQESSFDPQVMQIGGRSQDPVDAKDLGWGIIQWSGNGTSGRSTADKFNSEFAESGVTGKIYELATQLDLVWQHMQNHPIVTATFDLDYYKTITNEVEAAKYFGKQIEGFGESGKRLQYATDELKQYGGSSSSSDTTNSGTGCSFSADSNCSGISGSPKILCEAQKYQGIYYEYGGGHGVGYTAFRANCPDPTNPPNNQPYGGPVVADGKSGNPSPCGLDCSGLVSVALDDAFGQTFMWSVQQGSMQGSGNQYWESIPIAQATSGDIVTRTEHVELVDHVSNGVVYTFGTRETGTKSGPVNQTISHWLYAWHWTGPGSGG